MLDQAKGNSPDIILKTAVTRFRQHDFGEADVRQAEQFRRGHA